MSQVDPSVIAEIKEKQLTGCPAENKISLVITGHQEDPAAKATFFQIVATRVDPSGAEQSANNSCRYSQLLELNEKLIYNYGQIRLLRTFPPKKFVGNRVGDFVVMRRDALQAWLTELVLDEEMAVEPEILHFFQLSE